MTAFPTRRPRRLRVSPALRGLVRETRLSASQLIQPLFVVEDASTAGPVASMPGVERYSLDRLDRAVDEIVARGIQAIILFGVPVRKDATGSSAHDDDGVATRAVRQIKSRCPPLAVITDVCLCQYTDHGHCGVLREGCVENDATLEVLRRVALSHARAGADLVAPSGMMDGAVGAIRTALDGAGFPDTGILAYAVKYASAFYGPFRDAAESAPKSGDRRGYQMDPANAREALAEAALDAQEGADILMVKPALPCLDVIRRVRDAFPHHPLAAYQVSGEYSMIQAAAKNGWLDERAVVLESLIAIRRAGADMILTYFAKQAAGWID